ncbi:hypothetical protein [Lacticaseibacillus camelliae]|uniref:Uncharacterized protein n=1 Tax=Lacticaseibacillus camelliae DSM 22697 = JCM 13995 TaxID=1423730 RepID=A0A0R2FA07_9LACO|nr:hypothetical protein [Lacticaseibacillus camelliae]KRN22218.1 hypothetical protein FC75_GL001854 [Lacticaseibacillus camelliae DSM 22697 = JCM 13995]
MEEKQLRALIADAADSVVANEFTETQIQSRAAEWQKAVPNATLAEATTYVLAENRAFTEALLAQVLAKMTKSAQD